LLPFICDVTVPEGVQAVVGEVSNHWGGLDILINNACLALFTPFDERTLDDTRREFEVNYFGYLNLIRAVLPVMKKQGHGTVHNFSSGVGFTGMPGMTGYTSTKGAIEALTRTRPAAGFGIPPEMMADPEVVGRGLANVVGKTRSMLAVGFVNNLQLQMRYHLRVPMGKLTSMLSDKARQNQIKSW
jgi:hypothetical protein